MMLAIDFSPESHTFKSIELGSARKSPGLMFNSWYYNCWLMATFLSWDLHL